MTIEIEIDEKIDTTSEEINRIVDLDGGFYDLCTIKFLRECEEDIEAIWKSWLEAAKIEKFKNDHAWYFQRHPCLRA